MEQINELVGTEIGKLLVRYFRINGELRSQACPLYIELDCSPYWISFSDELDDWDIKNESDVPQDETWEIDGTKFNYKIQNLGVELGLTGKKLLKANTERTRVDSKLMCTFEGGVVLSWQYDYASGIDSLTVSPSSS